MNSLLSAYPENGLELYNTLDYWQCKELLDIISSSRCEPEDRLQDIENTKFNKYLDKKAYNKVKWLYLDNKYNLFNIYKKSKDLI